MHVEVSTSKDPRGATGVSEPITCDIIGCAEATRMSRPYLEGFLHIRKPGWFLESRPSATSFM